MDPGGRNSGVAFEANGTRNDPRNNANSDAAARSASATPAGVSALGLLPGSTVTHPSAVLPAVLPPTGGGDPKAPVTTLFVAAGILFCAGWIMLKQAAKS